jgi:hypothetical protein
VEEYKNNPNCALVSDLYIANGGRYNYMIKSGINTDRYLACSYYANKDDVISSVEAYYEKINNNISYNP